jgi:hypothetical protein
VTSSDRSDLTIAIEQLKAAASHLPSCERAAKLKGLILRLEGEVANDTDVSETVTRLLHATELALDHDPWMRLVRIAQGLSHLRDRSPRILNDAARDGRSLATPGVERRRPKSSRAKVNG